MLRIETAGSNAMIAFATSRTLARWVGAASLVFWAAIALVAQEQNALIELSPTYPTDRDVVTFKLSGTWPNGCVPRSPVVSISPGLVQIDTSNPNTVCAQVLSPWALTGTVGKLTPGSYDIVARFSGPGLSSPLELDRKSLTVSDSSLLN